MKKVFAVLCLSLALVFGLTACEWAIFDPPPHEVEAPADDDHGESVADDGDAESTAAH